MVTAAAQKKLNLDIMKRGLKGDGGVQLASEGRALALNFSKNGYKGVRVVEGKFPFQARGPKVNHVQPSLGTFATPREAAVAYRLGHATARTA